MSKNNRNTSENDNKNTREVIFHPENAVPREFKAAPERQRDVFAVSLTMMGKGMEPTCAVSPLASLGHGVYELKINGRPAWRCIYTTEVAGKIVVLHVTEKTTNGSDRQIANVVEERLKTLREKLKQARKQQSKM
ncbi:type II toxin-antitoxin system RelE/ParE family toxin [Pseudomonas fragi]|jgi:phage-related protein|uniref:type II toxin-antitoxin system RelE/ParE family toxin n=1 Tax=Pseudomonas fragi TaxID=296 RepID=UPI0030A38665